MCFHKRYIFTVCGHIVFANPPCESQKVWPPIRTRLSTDDPTSPTCIGPRRPPHIPIMELGQRCDADAIQHHGYATTKICKLCLVCQRRRDGMLKQLQEERKREDMPSTGLEVTEKERVSALPMLKEDIKKTWLNPGQKLDFEDEFATWREDEKHEDNVRWE
ncbi:MAG: hypothetical protein M1834_005126 [Cirrosporium novae-zelandiae]|nr:MAG: hypothetical protein M1834_005126 [Cirrosporium novae-zelandiae]